MSDNPQVQVWNDAVGDAWANAADEYDAMLEPFGDAVVARLDIRPGDRVVDIGCGAGATSIRLAAAGASVLGVDLSAPMLAKAAQRAAAAGVTEVEFARSDVEAAPPGEATFDAAFSRFGVMFFTDPVRAFSNVRASLARGGRLGFVCFQGPFDNPFIVVPVMAAAAHLPVPPPPGPHEPGPFSLADPQRIVSVLDAAGFTEVAVEAGPTSVVLGRADALPDIARLVLEQNPGVGPTLRAVAPSVRQTALDAAAAVLAPYVVDGEVVLGAATWIVTAIAP